MTNDETEARVDEGTSRRDVLRGALAFGGATALGVALDAGTVVAAPDPFRLGVASGDADTDSVVLWTRLTTDPTAAGTDFGMRGRRDRFTVRWRIARTVGDLASNSTSVANGEVVARRSHAYAVHALARGLAAGRTYYYRFFVDFGGEVRRSPIGRTKTAFGPNDRREVRFAVVNCQNIDGGDRELFHTGLLDLADRSDVDFVVFLGDYIYDTYRRFHLPRHAPRSLADYRTRYGQYKVRAGLRRVHQNFPVYVVADNHDYWNRVNKDFPLRGREVARFNRALRALWENMPLRTRIDTSDDKHALRLYRRIEWGRWLSMFLSDKRQYRGATLLGAAQQRALTDWLADRSVRWMSLATSEPISHAGSGWAAFRGARGEVLDAFAAMPRRPNRPATPVVVSGDLHCGMVRRVLRGDDVVATEFVNAPMSSRTDTTYRPNAQIKAAYNDQYGYMMCVASRTEWRTRFICSPDGNRLGGDPVARVPWVIPAFRPANVHHP